jgi:hypothetical protein
MRPSTNTPGPRSAAVELRCPHYVDEDGGLCGIWQHRNSTCATWFCKHDRGSVGHTFWRSTQSWLASIEDALARHAVLALDVGDEAEALLFRRRARPADGEALDARAVDGRPPAQYARAWGRWMGREEAFYLAAAEVIEPLSWADVEAIAGVESKAHARLVVRAKDRLDHARVAPRLVQAPLRIGRRAKGKTSVSGYSPTDPWSFRPRSFPSWVASTGDRWRRC